MFDVFEKVKEYKSIAISAHERPDGDAIGSCLGLYFYLKKRLPDTKISVLLDKTDDCFSIVPGIEEIIADYDENLIFDVYIVLDSEPARIGKFIDTFNKSKFTINVDHHKSNLGNICNLEYIVPEASSASELVYEIINKEYLDSTISQCIYIGIAHDTGIFRFSNVSPKTLRIAGELLEFKFDFSHLLDITYFEKTYIQNVLQAKVVSESKLYLDGLLIVGIADMNLILHNNANKSDFDGCVNQLLLTKGVHAAVFIYETEKDKYKCSMRACSDLIDVSQICEKFGGGGHVRASGCEFIGKLETFLDEIIKYVGEQIDG